VKKKLNSDSDEGSDFLIELLNQQSSLVKRSNNKIYIFGLIDDKSAVNIIASLHEIHEELESFRSGEQETRYTALEIHLNSEGGIVYDALALYDTIKKIEKNFVVKVFCSGKVMSAAFLVLAAGSKGFRFAGRNTTFMLHQVQTQTIGNQSDSENELKESRRLQNQYLEIISKSSKKSKSDLSKIIQSGKNSYFSAKEAVEMGFLDHIA